MPTLVCEQAVAIGGKAGVLRELEGAGFNVPAFEVNPQCVQDAVIQLGFPLAVRSSASVEDGDEASFAGQFESFLNLTTIEQVTEAIERCHESASEPSAIEYCRRNRIDPD